MKTNYFFILKSFVFGIGILAFVISFFSSTSVFRYIGVLGWIFLNVLIHEFGHLFGCLINHNKITGLSFYWFDYSEGKLKPNNNIAFKSYCKFKKKADNSIVYLMGPVFSLVMLAVAILLSANLSFNFLYIVISAAGVITNCIPLRNSDINKFIFEIR